MMFLRRKTRFLTVTWLVFHDIVMHELVNNDALVCIEESYVSVWLRGIVSSLFQVFEPLIFEKARAKANGPSLN